MSYDFNAARDWQDGLKLYYRRLKRMGLLTPGAAQGITALIDDIEREISEAHLVTKERRPLLATVAVR